MMQMLLNSEIPILFTKGFFFFIKVHLSSGIEKYKERRLSEETLG